MSIGASCRTAWIASLSATAPRTTAASGRIDILYRAEAGAGRGPRSRPAGKNSARRVIVRARRSDVGASLHAMYRSRPRLSSPDLTCESIMRMLVLEGEGVFDQLENPWYGPRRGDWCGRSRGDGESDRQGSPVRGPARLDRDEPRRAFRARVRAAQSRAALRGAVRAAP